MPKSLGCTFYSKLNGLLTDAGFNEWPEKQCATYYAAKLGRDSTSKGICARVILVGYIVGIPQAPDDSNLSRIHSRLPLEDQEAMFVVI